MSASPAERSAARAPGAPAAGGGVPSRRPWRILFVVTTTGVGGTETFLHHLATGLDRGRFAPALISLCPLGVTGEQTGAAGVPVESFGMSERPRPGELVAGVRRLTRAIDGSGVDLVHGLLYRANALAPLAARLSRRRPVVIAGQRSLGPMTGRAAGLAARLARRWCDRVVAVSDAVRERLDLEGVAHERLTVIDNGVDTVAFAPADRALARRRLGLGPDAVVAGGVGRLAPEKGFDLLLDAVAAAHRRCPSLVLVVAGDGPERERLERQAEEAGLGGAVRFLGFRDDLGTIYQALDVFVLPSLEEGSPNALLEAMSCGCAAVAAEVGGVPEIVEDGRSGLLVPAASADALADRIVRLAEDADLRRRLGRGARRRVEDRYSLERMIERHERLYAALLATRAGAARRRRPAAAGDGDV